jgi:hypothetical protein
MVDRTNDQPFVHQNFKAVYIDQSDILDLIEQSEETEL